MKLPLLLGAITLLPLAAPAASIYFESFDAVTSSTNVSLGTLGWNGYFGDSATIADALISGSNRAGLLSATSGPNGSPANGYMFAQNTQGAGSVDYFLYTSTSVANSPWSALSASSLTGLTANWKRNGNSFTSGGYYFAIQVGTAWYVSATSHGTTAAPSLDLMAATWRPLDLQTGTGGHLQVGAGSSTFAGLFPGNEQINGIGFFIENLATSSSANNTIRLDDINVDAVPEPSSSLGLLGVMIFLFLRKR